MSVTVSELQARMSVDQSSRAKFKRDMADVDRTMDRTSKSGGRAFSALGAAAKAGFLVAGAAVVAGAGYSIKAASDLGESVNAVQVVFGKASDKIFEFGKTSATSAGLSARAFNQAVTPIGAALRNVGLSADEAAEASIDLGQRAADMASVFNVDVSEALTAIQAGLRGEADPLERFGVGLSEAALQSYAVKTGMAGANDELTAGQKVQARLGLLMEQTNRVAGDFANTSDGLANSTRILRARLEDSAAAIGTVLLPIATRLVGYFNDHVLPLIERFSGFLEGIAKQRTARMKLEFIWAGTTGFIEELLFGTEAKRIKIPIDQRHFEWQTQAAGKGLVDVIQEAIENADWGEVGKAMAFGIRDAFMDAASHIPARAGDFVRAIGLDPDKDYQKEFGKWIDKQLGNIGQELNPKNWKWGNLGKWLSDQFAFQQVGATARRTWGRIAGFSADAADSTKRHWSDTIGWLRSQVSSLADWITDKWGDIRSGFVDVMDRIREKASSVWGKVKDAVGGATDAVRNFFQWIRNGLDKITGPLRTLGNIFGGVKDAVSNLNPFGDGLIGVSLGGTAGGSISPTLSDDLGLAQAMGLVLSSGYRPGAVTLTGNPSLHGVFPSKAIDVSGSESAMAAFFRAEIGRGGIRELIHNPYAWYPGAGLVNIAGTQLGRDHIDHVHVGSYDQGGWLQPGLTLARNNTGRPEPVGFGGNVYNFNGPVLDGDKLLKFIQSHSAQYERRNGRRPF